MKAIIRSAPDKAGNKAVYFAVNDGEEMNSMVKYLSDGWVNTEIRRIVNVDRVHEGILKRCSVGSENEQINLRWYFNQQPELGGSKMKLDEMKLKDIKFQLDNLAEVYYTTSVPEIKERNRGFCQGIAFVLGKLGYGVDWDDGVATIVKEGE